VNKTLLNRLAALEAARRPVETKPVDEELLIGRLQLFLAGRNHNKHVLSTRLAVIRHRQPHESGLTAYARDVGYADEAELFHVAFNDRAEFERRHLGTLQTSDPHISCRRANPLPARYSPRRRGHHYRGRAGASGARRDVPVVGHPPWPVACAPVPSGELPAGRR
jgi:hypothetical protein